VRLQRFQARAPARQQVSVECHPYSRHLSLGVGALHLSQPIFLRLFIVALVPGASAALASGLLDATPQPPRVPVVGLRLVPMLSRLMSTGRSEEVGPGLHKPMMLPGHVKVAQRTGTPSCVTQGLGLTWKSQRKVGTRSVPHRSYFLPTCDGGSRGMLTCALLAHPATASTSTTAAGVGGADKR